MGRSRKSRKQKAGLFRWGLRLVAILVLLGVGFAAWFWWDMRSWRPDNAMYPEQGAAIASASADIRFETLEAIGADFVYLALARASAAPDPGFAARLKRARASGIPVGVIQQFDPCLRADEQSARFTRMVPRDETLLQPAIALQSTAAACQPAVSDAAVESELMTLINQIELHSGKPVILKIGREFEAQHGMARSVSRDLWLVRDRARPDYAGRPWLLWSANSQLVTEASKTPMEWVVVQR